MQVVADALLLAVADPRRDLALEQLALRDVVDTASQWSAPSITNGVTTQAAANTLPSRRRHSNSAGSTRRHQLGAQAALGPGQVVTSSRNRSATERRRARPAVAEQFVEGRVGQPDRIARVDQLHALAHGLEDARLQAQHHLVAALAGDLGDGHHHADDRFRREHRLARSSSTLGPPRLSSSTCRALRVGIAPGEHAIDELLAPSWVVRRGELLRRCARRAVRATCPAPAGCRRRCAAADRPAAASRREFGDRAQPQLRLVQRILGAFALVMSCEADRRGSRCRWRGRRTAAASVCSQRRLPSRLRACSVSDTCSPRHSRRIQVLAEGDLPRRRRTMARPSAWKRTGGAESGLHRSPTAPASCRSAGSTVRRRSRA